MIAIPAEPVLSVAEGVYNGVVWKSGELEVPFG